MAVKSPLQALIETHFGRCTDKLPLSFNGDSFVTGCADGAGSFLGDGDGWGSIEPHTWSIGSPVEDGEWSDVFFTTELLRRGLPLEP